MTRPTLYGLEPMGTDGFDRPFAINLLQGWVTQLEAHIADPPTTDEEWSA